MERVVTLTLETTPADATHWSTRSMARRSGLSQSAISRIWRAFALEPHRTKTFKLSKDPLFIEKVRDVVGLYLKPPDKALVLCVDEKSGIQALDRTAPLLPMRPGQVERRTHDYTRHGTTDLFAALEVAIGRVIARCQRRHRLADFRRLLDATQASVPAELDVHMILDNSAFHKTALIRLAGTASAIPCALRADEFIVAQPGGEMVWAVDGEATPSWRVPQHTGA